MALLVTVPTSLGRFPFCVRHHPRAPSNESVCSSNTECTGTHVGYDAVGVLQGSGISNFRISDAGASTANALTNVMILHPVACGLNFIAFLLAVGASVVGSFLASMMALLAFLVRSRDPSIPSPSSPTVIANARPYRSLSWCSLRTLLASLSSGTPSTVPAPAPMPPTGPLRGPCWPPLCSRSSAPSSSSSRAARPGSTVVARPGPRPSTTRALPAPVAAGSRCLLACSVAMRTPSMPLCRARAERYHDLWNEFERAGAGKRKAWKEIELYWLLLIPLYPIFSLLLPLLAI